MWFMPDSQALGPCSLQQHHELCAPLEQEGPYFVYQEWSSNLSPFEFLLPDSQSPSIKVVPPLSNTHSIPTVLQYTHLHASQLRRFLRRAGPLLGCFTVVQVLQYLQAALTVPMLSLCSHCAHCMSWYRTIAPRTPGRLSSWSLWVQHLHPPSTGNLVLCAFLCKASYLIYT